MIRRRWKATWKKLHRHRKDALNTLPTELVHLLVAFLDFSSLCALRQTCTSLNDKIRPVFARRGFETVRTDLSTSSLQRLQEITECCALRSEVRHLLVTCDETPFGTSFRWDRDANGRLVDPSQQPGVLQLRQILQHLASCTSFQVETWRSDEPSLDLLSRADALTIVLHVMIDVGRPVTSFAANFCPSMGSGAGVVDPRLVILPELSPSTWGTLRELTINCRLSQECTGAAEPPPDVRTQLILHAPALRKLRLDLDQCLDGHLVLTQLVARAQPTGLEEIALKSCSQVSGNDLLTVLRGSRHSLCKISLEHLRLSSGAHWETILQCLRDEFPCLQSITFWRLLMEPRTVLHFPILSENPIVGATPFQWHSRWYRGERRNWMVSYSGPNVRDALDILLDSMERV